MSEIKDPFHLEPILIINEKNRKTMNDTTPTPFNKENFKKLIQATAEAKEEHFDMAAFAWHPELDGSETPSGVPDCGAPACVIGNYCAREDLQREFKLRSPGKWGRMRPVEAIGNDFVRYDDHLFLMHFGISRREAHDLFSEEGCGYAYRNKEKALSYLRLFYKEKTGEAAP